MITPDQPAESRTEWAVWQSGDYITPFESEEVARHDYAAVERMARAMWRGGIWNPDTHLLDDWRAAAHVALTALRRGGDPA